MHIEITVNGGLGELALEAMGLHGASVAPVTMITVSPEHLQLVLQSVYGAGCDIRSVEGPGLV